MTSRLTVLISDLRDGHDILASQLTNLILSLDNTTLAEGGYLIDIDTMQSLLAVLDRGKLGLNLINDAVAKLEEAQAGVEAVKSTRPGTTDKLTLERLVKEI